MTNHGEFYRRRYREFWRFSVESGQKITWREALRNAVRLNGERWPEDVHAVSFPAELELQFTVDQPSFYEDIDLVVWTKRWVYCASVEEGIGHVSAVKRDPSAADPLLPEDVTGALDAEAQTPRSSGEPGGPDGSAGEDRPVGEAANSPASGMGLTGEQLEWLGKAWEQQRALLEEARQAARTYWQWVDERYRPHAPWFAWLDAPPDPDAPLIAYLSWDGTRDSQGRGVVTVPYCSRESEVLSPGVIVPFEGPDGVLVEVFVFQTETTEKMERLRVVFRPWAELVAGGAR